MVLDLNRIFLNEGESLPVSARFDFGKVEFFGGYPLKKPVKVEGTVKNRAGVVELRLVCTVSYTAPCDRCYVETTAEYKIPVVKTLVTERENEDDDELMLLKDRKLDLEELCYEEVIPRLPMKHLCREDCKGVCQKCGKDLNEGDCDCKKEIADPRFRKLGDLLKDR